MNWFYIEQGKQAGPVNDEQFEDMRRTGKIQADTMVWHEGMANWTPFRELNGEPQPAGSTSDGKGSDQTPEAVCAECGNLFPIDETIRYGNARVCAKCKPVFLQKLAEGGRINTGTFNYASVLTRFAAVFLDGLILGGITIALRLAVGINPVRTPGLQPGAGLLAVQFILMGVQVGIGIGYETILIGKYGATLGKMACKIRVVTADGGRVSYARAFGRHFAKILSTFTLLIGYLIAIFDNPQRRALHDYICNTRVIYNET
jgi:uncharacterized RDD family membrane protein YckC